MAGRPMNKKAVKKVQEYLKLGLNQAEIARIMQKDPVQVLRWVRYVQENHALLKED